MPCVIFANYFFVLFFCSSKHRGIWMIPENQDKQIDPDSGLPSLINMEKTDPRTLLLVSVNIGMLNHICITMWVYGYMY